MGLHVYGFSMLSSLKRGIAWENGIKSVPTSIVVEPGVIVLVRWVIYVGMKPLLSGPPPPPPTLMITSYLRPLTVNDTILTNG